MLLSSYINITFWLQAYVLFIFSALDRAIILSFRNKLYAYGRNSAKICYYYFFFVYISDWFIVNVKCLEVMQIQILNLFVYFVQIKYAGEVSSLIMHTTVYAWRMINSKRTNSTKKQMKALYDNVCVLPEHKHTIRINSM